MSNLRGRPLGLTPAPSRKENVACCVPGCGVSMRKDNLRARHYNIHVKYDSEGNPLSESDDLFETLTLEQKLHTKYFHDHSISESSQIPGLKRSAISSNINPFTLAKKRRTYDVTVATAEESASVEDTTDDGSPVVDVTSDEVSAVSDEPLSDFLR